MMMVVIMLFLLFVLSNFSSASGVRCCFLWARLVRCLGVAWPPGCGWCPGHAGEATNASQVKCVPEAQPEVRGKGSP